MDYYTIYISIIFLVKIVFVILAFTHLYLEFKNKSKSDLDKQVLFWKQRIEFIFITLLFFLFGFVLIITADWKIFLKESDIFKKLQFVV